MDDSQPEQGSSKHGNSAEGDTVGSLIYALVLHCWVKAHLNMVFPKKKKNSCFILSCKKKAA